MPATFGEWTSVVQILALALGALGVVVGMRSQVTILGAELHKLSESIDDLRRELSHLDRRVSFIEGRADREQTNRDKWESEYGDKGGR